MRKINAAAKGHAYPLPNMEQILRKLQAARYIHLGSKQRVPSNPLKGRIARDNGIHTARPWLIPI